MKQSGDCVQIVRTSRGGRVDTENWAKWILMPSCLRVMADQVGLAFRSNQAINDRRGGNRHQRMQAD